MRFASDEWLAAVAAALAEVSLDSGASARIIFEIPGRSWHLAVDGGRVVSFAAGPLGSADCVLRWTADGAAAVWRRELRGNGPARDGGQRRRCRRPLSRPAGTAGHP